MAKTLSLSVRAGVSWTYTSEGDFGNTVNSNTFSFSDSLSNGTAVDQADLLYLAQGSLSASGTLNLDLAGSLTDVFGATLTFARIKGIFIDFQSANTSSGITVGGHATAAALVGFVDATDKVTVKKNGVLLMSNPSATAWAITATTADIIKIVNDDGSNAALYRIAIWGASA